MMNKSSNKTLKYKMIIQIVKETYLILLRTFNRRISIPSFDIYLRFIIVIHNIIFLNLIIICIASCSGFQSSFLKI
jgi:hypothetical protein